MNWFSTLDRWLMLRCAKAYVTFTGAALFVFLLIDLFANLEDLTKREFLVAFYQRYGTMLPEIFFTLSPFLALLSALWVVASLQRQNELIPLVTAGLSARRLSWPFLLVGLLLAPLCWADRELLLPAVAHLRRAADFGSVEDGSDRTRQPRPIPDGENGVLSAYAYVSGRAELHKVRLTRLDENKAESFSIFAAVAEYQPSEGERSSGWLMRDGYRIDRSLDEDGLNRDVIARIGSEGLFLPSRVLLTDVEAAIERPTFLSASQLRDQLKRTPGFKHLEVQIYERITYPLSGVVLLLLGVPLALAGKGGLDSFLRMMACLLLCMGYFVISTLVMELGSREVLSPVVAAFSPMVIFTCLGALFAAGRFERAG